MTEALTEQEKTTLCKNSIGRVIEMSMDLLDGIDDPAGENAELNTNLDDWISLKGIVRHLWEAERERIHQAGRKIPIVVPDLDKIPYHECYKTDENGYRWVLLTAAQFKQTLKTDEFDKQLMKLEEQVVELQDEMRVRGERQE